MYCDYFGFREKPFNITPNPRFLYLSKNHKEAFAHLLYGINNHAGFIELTGEVGTGKTTVLRTILEQLDDEHHRTAIILNPCLSSLELLRNINREFGIAYEGMENGALLEELNRFLLSENRAGRTVTLVIDEAQNLAPAVLEQIRLISNLETDSDKLIQILLAGQPELNTLLARQELRQLAQRITVRYHLLPMDFEDSSNYISHRLQVAGGGGWISFAPGALKRIYAYAKGSPRLLNIACDRALLIGYTEDSGTITAAIAATAIDELRGPRQRRGMSIKSLAIILLVLGGVVTASLIARTYGDKATATVPAPLGGQPSGSDMSAESWQGLAATAYPAVNTVFRLWGVAPVAERGPERTIATIAATNGFSSLPIPSLDLLRRLDTPAVVEIKSGKGKTARIVAVTAAANGSFTIAPVAEGSRTISEETLAAVWTGRGRILWQNRLGIPDSLNSRSPAADISRLQTLLTRGNWLQTGQTGVFDPATVAALRQLQQAEGVPVTGRADALTMLLLNRRYGTPLPPRLGAPDGNRQ